MSLSLLFPDYICACDTRVLGFSLFWRERPSPRMPPAWPPVKVVKSKLHNISIEKNVRWCLAKNSCRCRRKGTVLRLSSVLNVCEHQWWNFSSWWRCVGSVEDLHVATSSFSASPWIGVGGRALVERSPGVCHIRCCTRRPSGLGKQTCSGLMMGFSSRGCMLYCRGSTSDLLWLDYSS